MAAVETDGQAGALGLFFRHRELVDGCRGLSMGGREDVNLRYSKICGWVGASACQDFPNRGLAALLVRQRRWDVHVDRY